MVVDTFRRYVGYDAYIERYERKFILLFRWDVEDAVAILWTMQPVFSSAVVRSNENDVRSTLATSFKYLE